MSKDIYGKLKGIIKKLPSSKSGLLLLLGSLGIILVLVSSFDLKHTKAEKTDEGSKTVDITADGYSELLESKLEKIISDMLGGKKVSAMVTLKSSPEYIYASETLTDAEVKNDRSSYKTEQNDKNQNSYVIVKDGDGNEKAVVVRSIMPEIAGVVIVCDGGQNENVSVAVREAVRSALGIDENKICIIGRGQ